MAAGNLFHDGAFLASLPAADAAGYAAPQMPRRDDAPAEQARRDRFPAAGRVRPGRRRLRFRCAGLQAEAAADGEPRRHMLGRGVAAELEAISFRRLAATGRATAISESLPDDDDFTSAR